MHYLTSNFNLLNSNSHWEKLKKNHVNIDKNYNGLILSLSKKNLNNHNFFHSIFYIDESNFYQTIKELKSMIQVIKKNKEKYFFFIYLVIFMKTQYKKKY